MQDLHPYAGYGMLKCSTHPVWGPIKIRFEEIVMAHDNAYCKLIFDIKYIFLEQSADLLRILKHIFLNLRNE